MASLRLKVPGSTLIETIISMLIITVCMGIALVVVRQLFRTDQLKNQLHAFVIAKQELTEVENKRSFFNETMEIDNLILYKDIVSFDGNDNLIRVEITVQLKYNKEVLYRINKLFVNYDAVDPDEEK
ncbi:MAG: hypothetical protein U5Q03_18090 [Bacteroidota bacterium]|nr:hypothetical protein [Bacteroidota bacterium]